MREQIEGNPKMTTLYKIVQAENEVAAKLDGQIIVAISYTESMAYDLASNSKYWFVIPFTADYSKWRDVEISLTK